MLKNNKYVMKRRRVPRSSIEGSNEMSSAKTAEKERLQRTEWKERRERGRWNAKLMLKRNQSKSHSNWFNKFFFALSRSLRGLHALDQQLSHTGSPHNKFINMPCADRLYSSQKHCFESRNPERVIGKMFFRDTRKRLEAIFIGKVI